MNSLCYFRKSSELSVSALSQIGLSIFSIAFLSMRCLIEFLDFPQIEHFTGPMILQFINYFSRRTTHNDITTRVTDPLRSQPPSHAYIQCPFITFDFGFDPHSSVSPYMYMFLGWLSSSFDQHRPCVKHSVCIIHALYPV